ncbi:uncharacterized protein BX664DRAFT_331406, partial [Halteromyces radiatus]|uniref:uncharacterized protein n=1 Tax=Halteromyces radiatus TaxID=101107 RepID=UPI00221F44B5
MPPDFDMVKSSIEQPPSILITSPDVGNTTTMDNFYMTLQQQPSSPSSSSSSSPFMQAPVLSSQTNQFHQHTNNSNNSKHHLRRNTPLTVQTQNLSSPMDMNFLSDGRSPTSPYSNYHTPMASTPVSPNAFLSDDDAISPRTPNTISPSQPPNSSESVMMNHLLQQEQQHQQQIDHQQSHHEQQQLLHIQMGQMLANDRFSFRM